MMSAVPSRRRLARLLARVGVDAGTAASFLLCAAAAVLWARSYGGEDARSFRLGQQDGGARYTVRSAGGRVTLYAPPPEPAVGGGAAGAAARNWVAALRNDQVRWAEHHAGVFAQIYQGLASRRHDLGTATPGLLGALDDPDRWAAAHLVLVTVHAPERLAATTGTILTFDGNTGSQLDGLHVTVGDDHRGIADPADQPTLRDRWHRALDVEVAHVPHAGLVAALALGPAARLVLAVRRRRARRRRRREGRCIACGYDCRATPGRCPECGGGRPLVSA